MPFPMFHQYFRTNDHKIKEFESLNDCKRSYSFPHSPLISNNQSMPTFVKEFQSFNLMLEQLPRANLRRNLRQRIIAFIRHFVQL